MSSPKNTNTEPSVPRPSRLSRGLITFIGISRTLAGVGFLLAPTMTAKVFGFSTLSADAALFVRAFGAREIVIGEGLLSLLLAESASHGSLHPQAAHQHVSRAIWGNIAADGLDVVAVLLTLATGVADGVPLGRMAATAGLFAVLGLEAAWLYK